MKKRISESTLGIEYLSDVIATCDQNGIECIVDDKNGDIYYYDPKGRKYGDDKLLHDNDALIWDIVEDKKLFDSILFDASGAIFKDFAVKWNELQRKDEGDEVYKTKICRPIRGNFSESKEDNLVDWCGHPMTKEQAELCDKFWGGEDDLAGEFESDWEDEFGKSAWYWSTSQHSQIEDDLESRPEEFETNGYTDEYEEWGQNIVADAVCAHGLTTWEEVHDYIEASLKRTFMEKSQKVDEDIDNPNDWSASEGEVEIMWDTDEYEDFGIFKGEGSTYLIDYDRVDTHDDLINEVCRLIGKEYPDLDFDPSDFVIVNEDEFWEQRGGDPGKWEDEMYSEDSIGESDKYDVEIEFTRSHYGKELKPGDRKTIEIDLSEAPDCYDLDDLKDFVAKYATEQIPGGGIIEGYAFDILNEKDLVYILKGDEGWGEDVVFDFDKNTPDDIPDTLTEKEGMKYFEKMREAYHDHKLKYDRYREFSDKLFDAIVKGLLKTASIEELGKEWFKDYGTKNGWNWKTAFKYNVASALHEIHKKKHPEEHKNIPQKYHWRGWDEDNCSCGLCSSSDSSD